MNKQASLTPAARMVLLDKGTERPFSGAYNEFKQIGSYVCRLCGLALFRADNKFTSSCGWPSFDEAISGMVMGLLDADGQRTEVLCSGCQAHLGHVFTGEGYTNKNTRFCINSLAVDFVHSTSVRGTFEAIFAGGCFWGVEHLFKQLPGIVLSECGYTGGNIDNPNYEAVCAETTGHYEAVRVLYDTDKLSYRDVCQYFLEIHDPTQADGQGPDIGASYRSAIFYYDDQQKQVAAENVALLEQQGLQVVTCLLPVSVFWPAEAYHQAYYQKQGSAPYCHQRVRRF